MPTPKTKINQKENQIIFWLNTKNYPLEAIYSAAYVFIDRCYVYLDGDTLKEITVYLTAKEDSTKETLKNLQGQFLNELLNYLLRVEVARNNQKIREYIVASALVSSLPSEIADRPLPQETRDSADWRNDPLGIAVSWEDKQPATAKKLSRKKK